MRQDDRFTVINIREYLKKNDDGEGQFGEDDLRQILSEFSCEKNQDVEDFLKRQAIDFTNKNQSVTYLVFATDKMTRRCVSLHRLCCHFSSAFRQNKSAICSQYNLAVTLGEGKGSQGGSVNQYITEQMVIHKGLRVLRKRTYEYSPT